MHSDRIVIQPPLARGLQDVRSAGNVCLPNFPAIGPVTSLMRLQITLQRRANELRAWLETHGQDCWDRQKHLDDGTTEQVYWHFGYLAAVQDVLTQLRKPPD